MKQSDFTKSKILCTLGPASNAEEKIKELIHNGMNCVRINFSHGDDRGKTEIFDRVKKVAPEIAILCDIQGPKLRIGFVKDGVSVRRGAPIILTTEEVEGDWDRITVSYKNLPSEVKTGELIFINDGIVCIEVNKVEGTEIYCTVVTGGELFTRKGLNLPHTELGLRVPTEKDLHDLKLIAKLNPAYVAASFVGSADDVHTIRQLLETYGNPDIKIISKIERPIAVKNFEEILEASDGIMVARGDLGVELPAEEVPPVQKAMIKRCNIVGKPVIVATQMLESMVKQPIATRAEVSDVYNAIEDGADCVMLSAETASGDFPAEAVEVMHRIIKNSDSHMPTRDADLFDSPSRATAETMGHLVHSACEQLKRQNIKKVKILCLTKSGFSARMISKYRPPFPLLAVTYVPRATWEMNFLWGVTPVLIPELEEAQKTWERVKVATEECMKKGIIDKGDTIVLVGDFFNLPHSTNMISIFQASEIVNMA